MPTPEKRLRLMQLASSNLPVGGYSWSQGLEWAVEAGWVPDAAAFERWQQQQMEQSFLPSIFLCSPGCIGHAKTTICRQHSAGPRLLACRETRELREEERNRGTAFARLLADWQPDCPPAWRGLCRQSQLAGMAWLGVRWQIALPDGAEPWLQLDRKRGHGGR